MFVPRHGLVLLLAALIASTTGAAAQTPRISKPRPAPPSVSPIPALPLAAINDTLAIGGQDLKARQVETRLSLEAHINGRGPYQFIVDSGADISVVGLRIARFR